MNLLAIEMPDAQMQFTGWLVTIIGFTIVIVSLIILFLVFKYISKLINYDWSKPKKSKKENTVLETKSSEDIDPNIAAAIAANKEITPTIKNPHSLFAKGTLNEVSSSLYQSDLLVEV